MAKVERNLRVLNCRNPPSSDHFSFAIEPRNIPAVFNGAVADWDAVLKWDPAKGGLDYLQEKVGPVNVDGMLSDYAPVFYGDLRSHERVPVLMSSFISSCKIYAQAKGIASISSVAREDSAALPVNPEELDSFDQLFLAQVPILNTEEKGRSPLEILRNDIQTPAFLASKSLTSINLWMNKTPSRSSIHYDPFHNLLCVVAGCKQVVLWPPSACPYLYPMPIHGESSNHSAVDIENPDLSVHLRSKDAKEYSQTVILHSGDALFIPEGWFHQVDSNDLTIAVNFWWKSSMMSCMLEHMEAYYLRRILNRLVEKEMKCMLYESSISSQEGRKNVEPMVEALEGHHEPDINDRIQNVRRNDEKHGLMMQDLEPLAASVFYDLTSLVHDTVKVLGQSEAVECSTLRSSVVSPKGEHKQSERENSTSLENDPVARIIWTVEALTLKKVLVAMVHHFPKTLEALILHVMSPIAAEVLTRKFEEMDVRTTKEEQTEFYKLFYSAFDDSFAAMDVILSRKEIFAFQAVQNVLDQYLGIYVDKPK